MFKRARRTVAAITVALGLGIASAVWATTAASAAPTSIPPVCSSADLAVWVNVDQGQGALGTWYYPLEFTNVSSHTCRVRGYPGVSATSATGKQLGNAAFRNTVFEAEWVNIPADGTAHALFGYGAALVNTSNCAPVNASFLKVYPPNQASARTTFFDYPSCTKSGHDYLQVSVLQPGTGI